MDFEQEETRIGNFALELERCESRVNDATEAWAKAERFLKHALEAQEILQLIAQAVQQQAHEKIAKVVSSCLQAVFDDPYEFKIEFERKRGRTEAKLLFLRRGLICDPTSASGGGVIDVAAFALRAVCIMLHRPRLSKILFLDEPFRFVSAEYQDNVRTMLEELSEDLGVQIVQITHNEKIATGKIVRVE